MDFNLLDVVEVEPVLLKLVSSLHIKILESTDLYDYVSFLDYMKDKLFLEKFKSLIFSFSAYECDFVSTYMYRRIFSLLPQMLAENIYIEGF